MNPSGANYTPGQYGRLPLSRPRIALRVVFRQSKFNDICRRDRFSMRCSFLGHESGPEHQNLSGSFPTEETKEFSRILSSEDSRYQATAHSGPTTETQVQKGSLQDFTIGRLTSDKGLGLGYLRDSLDWRDTSYHNAPAIEIPYYNTERLTLKITWRLATRKGSWDKLWRHILYEIALHAVDLAVGPRSPPLSAKCQIVPSKNYNCKRGN